MCLVSSTIRMEAVWLFPSVGLRKRNIQYYRTEYFGVLFLRNPYVCAEASLWAFDSCSSDVSNGLIVVVSSLSVVVLFGEKVSMIFGCLSKLGLELSDGKL